MIIVVTGVSAGDGDTEQVRQEFSRKMKVNAWEVVVFNPELYFDRSKLNQFNRAAIAVGAAWLKSQYGADFSAIGHSAMDKAQDVWLYLNPFWRRTRDLVDDMLTALLDQYPDADVYAHSLGSVVAYRCIQKKGYPSMRLITLGSPLWMRLVQQFLDVRFRTLPVNTWLNYYSSRDPIALKRVPAKLGILEGHQLNTHTSHDLMEYLELVRRKV